MKIDELAEMIKEASVIDNANLDRESTQIPYIHQKFYYFLVEELRALRGMELDFRRIKKEKSDYYLGRANDEVYKAKPLNFKVLKAELEVYLEADDEIISHESRIANQKIKVDMLEAFIRMIANRSYQIKNSIEFLKFKNGQS